MRVSRYRVGILVSLSASPEVACVFLSEDNRKRSEDARMNTNPAAVGWEKNDVSKYLQ